MTTMTVEGRRVYIKTEYGESVVALLKALGAKWDPESKRWWIGAVKKKEVEAALAEASQKQLTEKEPTSANEPDSSRVLAKINYKGKSYFVVVESPEKGRCKICRLEGSSFWVDMADCELIKTYYPRPERNFRGKPTGRFLHTTLGSIRSFVKQQREAEARGEQACSSCGKRGQKLCQDLEDGLMKCYTCCDIPE